MTTPAAPTPPHTPVDASIIAAFKFDEVSLVPRGANQLANVLTFKSDDAAGDVKKSAMSVARELIRGLRKSVVDLTTKHAVLADDVAPVLKAADEALFVADAAATGADDATHSGVPEGAPHHPVLTTPETPMADTIVTPAANTGASAEDVAKIAKLQGEHNTQLAEALAKNAASEAANKLLSERLDKMEQESADKVLTERTEKMFAGIPGEKGALKVLVSKLDADTTATLEKVLAFTREAAKSSHLFKAHGVSANESGDLTGAALATSRLNKIAEGMVARDGVSMAQAISKATENNPDLANELLRAERDY